MATSCYQWFLWTATILLIAVVSQGQLTTDFYDSTCPQAATIVKQKVDEIVDADKGMAAGLMRLHFHDCFVRVSSLSKMQLPDCCCQPELPLGAGFGFRISLDGFMTETARAGLRWVGASEFDQYYTCRKRSAHKQRLASRIRAYRRYKDGPRVFMPRRCVMCRHFGHGGEGRHR